MECGCMDGCCSYGCPVDVVEVERIMAYKDELEKRLGIGASKWFVGGVETNSDYPSKYVRRTSVFNGNCIFHDWNTRGCLLHRMAIEKSIDPHLIKPMVCFFFPITWDGDYLHVAEFLEELPCKQHGDLIVDSVMNEIRYYLGEDVAAEIESLRKQH
jgi:Fe-S-cluster containining protein